MAELNTQFPAWLAQRQSWMEQNRSGQEFLQGAQLGANLAARQREEAYRERALQLERDAFELKRQSTLQANEGMVELGKTLSGIAANGDWASPAAEEKFWATVTRYPGVTQSPNFDNLAGIFERAKQAKANLELARERNARGFAPGPLEKDLSYYQGLLANPNTPPEILSLARAQLQSKAQTSGFSVKFGPGGTVEEVNYGPQKAGASPGEPTVAFKTKLQEQLASTENTLELISNMQQNMTEADFGIAGLAREFKTRLAPQLGFDVQEDLSVRKTIPLLRAALQKELKSDSNITEAERKDIQRALPSESWLESRESAAQSLNVLVPWLKNRARRSAESLGVQIPYSVSTAEEVRQAYQSGKLTLEQARDIIKRFNLAVPTIPGLPVDEGPAPMIENAR